MSLVIGIIDIDPVVELVLVDKVGPLLPVSQGIDCKDLYALAAVRLEDLTVELGYLLLAVTQDGSKKATIVISAFSSLRLYICPSMLSILIS